LISSRPLADAVRGTICQMYPLPGPFKFYSRVNGYVIIQTSKGSGSGYIWHIVPRTASANGRDDIKGYLNDRWSTVLGQIDSYMAVDLGWYYYFVAATRADQMEYVFAKAASIDMAVSIQTRMTTSGDNVALDDMVQGRHVMEMCARWEEAKAADAFSEATKTDMQVLGDEFKLYGNADDGWALYDVVYGEVRTVTAIDGAQNVWTVNVSGAGHYLGVEIVRDDTVGDMGNITIDVDASTETISHTIDPSESITTDYEGTKHWPGGMTESSDIEQAAIALSDGDNTVTIDCTGSWTGDVRVVVYSMKARSM